MKPNICQLFSCKNIVKARKFCSDECKTFDRLKTVSKLKKAVWVIYSSKVRQNHADKNGYVQCYTCPKKEMWNSGKIQAGHFKHGDNPGTWTNDKNVKPQCVTCNLFLSGNLSVYAVRLEEEYGHGILQEIDKAYHHPPQTWTMLTLRVEYRRVKAL